MGIRISKALGYALTDAAEGDPRLAASDEELLDGPRAAATLADLAAWGSALPEDDPCRGEAEMLGVLVAADPALAAEQVGDHVQRGCSETTPGVLLFVPPGLAGQWCRYDDCIDHYEERLSPAWDPRAATPDRVRAIPHGIHPYVGMMDRRTGQPVEYRRRNVAPAHIDWMERSCREAEEAGAPPPDWLAATGFATAREFLDNCVPMVPAEVRLLCRFLGVFRDPATALELRPVLWTCWS